MDVNALTGAMDSIEATRDPFVAVERTQKHLNEQPQMRPRMDMQAIANSSGGEWATPKEGEVVKNPESWAHIFHRTLGDPSKGILDKTLGFLAIPGNKLAEHLSQWTRTPYHPDNLHEQFTEWLAPKETPSNVTYGESFAALPGMALNLLPDSMLSERMKRLKTISQYNASMMLGLGAEFATDPTNYVSFGGGSVAEAATKEARSAAKLRQGIDIGRSTEPLIRPRIFEMDPHEGNVPQLAQHLLYNRLAAAHNGLYDEARQANEVLQQARKHHEIRPAIGAPQAAGAPAMTVADAEKQATTIDAKVKGFNELNQAAYGSAEAQAKYEQRLDKWRRDPNYKADPLGKGVTHPDASFEIQPGEDIGKWNQLAPKNIDQLLPNEVRSLASEGKLEAALDSLAKHQVLLEKQIAYDLPKTRFFGLHTPWLPIGPGGALREVPSPFAAISRMVKPALFGKYVKSDELNRPLEEVEKTLQPLVTKTKGADGKEVTEALRDSAGNPITFQTSREALLGHLSGKDAFGDTIMQLVGSQFAHGNPGVSSRLGLLFQKPHLEEWLIGTDAHPNSLLRHFTPEQREDAFRHVYSLYHGIWDFAEKHPNVELPNTKNELKEALVSLQEIHQNLQGRRDFWPTVDKLALSRENGKVVMGAAKLRDKGAGVRDLYSQHYNLMQQEFDKLKSAFESHLQSINKPSGAAPEAIDFAHHWAQFFNNESHRQTAEKIIRMQSQLIGARAPFRNNADFANLLFDGYRRARQTGDMFSHAHNMIEGYFDALPKEVRAGIDQLGKSLNGPDNKKAWGEVIAALKREDETKIRAEFARQQAKDPSLAGLSYDQWLDDIKSKLTDRALASHIKGSIGGEDLKQFREFIKPLTGEQLWRLADTMKKLASQTKYRNTSNALLSLAFDRFEDFLHGVRTAERAIFTKMAYPMEDEFAFTQWKHMPRRWLESQFVTKFHPIIERTYRDLGIPLRVIEAAHAHDGKRAMGKMVARDETLQWADKTLRGFLPEGKKTNKHLKMLDEAFVDVMDYGREYRYNLKHNLPNPPELAARVEKGMKNAEELFGPQYMERLKEIQGSLNDFLQPKVERERYYGSSLQEYRNYIPRNIMGSRDDLQALADLRSGDAQILAENAPTQVLAASDKSFASHRVFDNSWEVEESIRKANNILKEAGKDALDLQVNPSLTSRLMQRNYVHHRFVNNLEMMSELQAHLPQQVLPWKFMGAGGKSEVKHGNSIVKFVDVGSIIPEMRGWHVSPALYDYIKSHIVAHPEVSGTEKVADAFYGPVATAMRKLKALNMSFGLNHIKNQGANSLIGGGGNLLERGLDYMFGRRGLAKEGLWDRFKAKFKNLSSPFVPWGEALREDPMYKVALEGGGLNYSGHEYEIPLHEQAMAWLDPNQGKSFLNKLYRHGSGPTSAITFDVFETAMRMANVEHGISKGLTPYMASELSNRFLIDYGMRHLTPEAKRLGYTWFPFFAWHTGNWASHATNWMNNPAWYAFFSHAADDLSSDLYHRHLSEYPELLAGAFATPFTAPDSGNQVWVRPEFPWQSIVGLERRVMDHAAKGQPLAIPADVLHYIASRVWGVDRDLADMGLNPRASKTMEKKTLHDVLFGKSGIGGVVGDEFWGVKNYGLNEWLAPLFDPSLWSLKIQSPAFWHQLAQREGVSAQRTLQKIPMNVFTKSVEVQGNKVIY